MAQRIAVLAIGNEVQKPGEIVSPEMLGRRELPQDRSQLVAQFGKPLIEKLLNRISAFCQNLARSRIAGGLDGELETFRYGLGPFAPAGRLLPAIEGGI